MTDSGERAPRARLMHDLRTPLSVVKGSVETLLEHWDRIGQARRSDLLSRALANVDDLASAIDRVGSAPETAPRRTDPARASLEGMELVRRRGDFDAAVSLRLGDASVQGIGSAPGGGARLERRAVAVAVLNAVKGHSGGDVHIEELDLLDVGGDRIASVLIRLGSRLLLGSAIVRSDDYDAVARATLDALNRSLSSD
jgi:signal transduction histidine kinase